MTVDLPWWLLPTIISFGIFIVSYTLGKRSASYSTNEIIECTLLSLVERGYIRHRRVNGEIEILKLDGTSE